MRAYLATIVVMLLLAGAWFLVSVPPGAWFYAGELKAIHGEEFVVIGDQTYRVQNGAIAGIRDLSRERISEIYKLAYALELAKRNPILGSAGTNPVDLRARTTDLEKAVQVLAAAQTSPSDAENVRSALYPIAFLNALAEAESARLTFIASTTSETAAAYDRALQSAIRAGGTASARFQEAFSAYATSTMRFASLGGTFDTDSMLRAIAAIGTRFEELQRTLDLRRACLSGDTHSCTLGALALRDPSESFRAAPRQDAWPDIESLLTAADSASPYITVVLDESACTSALPAPYRFFVLGKLRAHKERLLTFANDLFFTRVSGTEQIGPVQAYLRDTLGIDYVRFNPMNYYSCPAVGADIGLIRAVYESVQFATLHPDIAPQERATLLAEGDGYREADARAYVSAALAQLRGQALPNGLVDLTRLFAEKSAWLDVLIEQITAVSAIDTGMLTRGVPFDVSARTLFLTHSAFPSLYLAANESAGQTAVSIYTHDVHALNAYLSRLTRYSGLPAEARAQIVHDLRAISAFEDAN